MKLWKNDADDALDRAAQEIRDETIDGPAARAAADRVWSRLAAGDSAAHADGSGAQASVGTASGAIGGCAGFRDLVPSYLAKRLSPSRALLFEDHVKECVPCRRTLTAARSITEGAGAGAGASVRGDLASIGAARRRGGRSVRWALAAAAAVVLGVVGRGLWNELGPVSGAGIAEVQSVQGSLYRVSSGASLPASDGATLPYGDAIRTAKDSRAVVRLSDGSLIEMKDRSELSLSANRTETTIRLARGSIIVQAAKQRGGHLYVATDDCRVAVVGTIFSVNHGSKGSRVTVIEGEVNVEQGRRESVLLPGQQVSTHASLETVPASEEIAWSRDAVRYQALLSELKALGRELDRTIPTPSLRHSTALLDSLPASTVLYVAVPNLTASLTDAHRLVQERIEQSDVLREWWETSMGPAKADPEIEELLGHVRQFGEQLGDEIVVAVQTDPHGKIEGVVLTAEIKSPDSFRPVLEGVIAKANTVHNVSPLRIVDDPEALADASGDAGSPMGRVLLWTHGNRLVVATQPAALRVAAAIVEGRGGERLSGTPFHARLAEAYRDGAEWLVGVDVGRMMERAITAGKNRPEAGRHEQVLQRTGLLDARHFIFESKHDGSRKSDHATLTFDQSRRGLASWLAAPAPMGALDFVTSDATFVVGFIVKNPSVLLGDLYGFMEAADPAFTERLARFESEQGISVRDDLAAPLGGEIVFALDGPVLPVPSWKLVVEVYDPLRFQATLARMIARVDEQIDPESRIDLTSEELGGTTWYTIRSPRASSEVHYVFTDGYLVAAPSRALLERARQARESGQMLASSEKYRALLPRDGQANFSAIAFQDLGSVLSPLARTFVPKQQNLSPQEREALGALGVDTPPKLVYAYGEPDRITFASTSEHSFTSGFGTLLDIQRFASIHQVLGQAARKAHEAHGVHGSHGADSADEPEGADGAEAADASPEHSH